MIGKNYYFSALLALFIMICQVIVSQAQNVDKSFNSDIRRIGINGSVESIAVQPDDKILISGNFTSITGVVVNHLARLHPDGSLDGSFNSIFREDDTIHAMELLEDGKILVAGNFKKYTTDYKGYSVGLHRLMPDGTMDESFNPQLSADWVGSAIKILPNGKILIVWAEVPGTYSDWKYRLARLNKDGSPDEGFNSTFAPSERRILDLDVQSDGKIILVGDNFRSSKGGLIARLEPNGTEDAAFAERISIRSDGSSGVKIRNISILPTDEILISGAFKFCNGHERYGVAKLKPDGSLEESFKNHFAPNSGFDNHLLLPDGKIMLSGFSGTRIEGGSVSSRFLRLNADGSPDELFPHLTGFDDGPYEIGTMALDHQHNFLLGGSLNRIGGMAAASMVRVRQDGTIDLSFKMGPGVEELSAVYALAVQEDLKVIVGGEFNYVDEVSRNHIARLNFDGSLDPTFNPGTGPSGVVYSTLLQPDGKIIVSGRFNHYNLKPTKNVIRLYKDGRLDESFVPDIKGGTYLYNLVLQPDGKILLKEMHSNEAGRIIRLKPDGSLDETFTPYPLAAYRYAPPLKIATFYPIGLQADGKILTQNIRLNPDGSPDQGYQPRQNTKFVAIEKDQHIIMRGGDFGSSSEPNDGLHRINPDGSVQQIFNETMQEDEVSALLIQSDGKIIVNATQEYMVSNPATYRLNPDGTFDESFFELGWDIAYDQHVLAYHTEEYVLAGETMRSYARIKGPLLRYKKKKEQTIDFPAIADQTFENTPIEIPLTATSSAGLAISYEVTAGAASVQNNSLHISAAGSITIKAFQQGNEQYASAAAISRTFCVNPQQPSISREGDTLLSSSATDNHWFKDGEMLEGATHATYQPTSPGLYTVRLRIEGCTSQASEGVRIDVFKPVWIPPIPKEITEGEDLRLAWEPVSSEASYTLKVSQSPEMENSSLYATDQAFLIISDLEACNQYYFSVKAIDKGNESDWSDVESTLVLPAFIPEVTTPGLLNACSGETIELQAPEGFAYYEWNNGSHEKSLMAEKGGEFSVRVANESGCWSKWSEPLSISFYEKPPTPALDSPGTSAACQGDELLLSAPEDFAYYQWNTGATSREIKVTEGGEYRVQVANHSGCWSDFSQAVQLRFHDLPEASISQDGIILTASEGAEYQWFLNNKELPDNSRSITAMETGAYQVKVTNEYGCSAVSPVLNIRISGLEENFAGLSVYPNPTGGKLQIRSDRIMDRVQLLTVNGRAIVDKRIKNTAFEYDISSYPAGIYFLQLSINGQRVRYKIVKL